MLEQQSELPASSSSSGSESENENEDTIPEQNDTQVPDGGLTLVDDVRSELLFQPPPPEQDEGNDS